MAESSDDQELTLLQEPLRLDKDSFKEIFDQHREENEQSKADGINFWQTAILISGSTTGFGFLAVEVLVVSTGWIAFALFCVLFAAIVFTSVLLGRCWNMVRAKCGKERHPYGAIGYEAFGGWARSFINFLVAGTAFTVVIGNSLAMAEVTLTIGGPALRGTFCYWPVIYSVVIGPLLWLGTPKDFWLVMASSYFTVVLSVVLMVVAILLAGDSGASSVISSGQDVAHESVVLHLAEIAGTLVWLLGLHPAYPTIQQDMQQPQSFGKAVVLANVSTCSLVLPMMLALFVVYGDTLNVTGSATVFTILPEDALKTVAAILIMVHLVGTVLIINNPLFQYLEEVLHIPSEFNWKRIVLRTFVLLLEVFIQESLPHFTLVTAISGSFFTPLIVFLMPCLCYLRLQKKHRQESFGQRSKDFLLETVACWVIIIATPFFMATVLFVTASKMAQGETVFTVPCYVNVSLARA